MFYAFLLFSHLLYPGFSFSGTPYIYIPECYPFVITYFETIFQCLLTNQSAYCIFVRSKAIRQTAKENEKVNQLGTMEHGNRTPYSYRCGYSLPGCNHLHLLNCESYLLNFGRYCHTKPITSCY